MKEEAALGTPANPSKAERIAGLVEAIKVDYTRAELNKKDRVMLDFIWKLAGDRRTLTEQDLVRLRDEGFSEHQILDIVLVAALAEFANCLVEGVGFQLGESLFPVLFGE